MNLIAFAFIMLIQLCSNSSSEERREQEDLELKELNELWNDRRIANHAFGAAMVSHTAKDVVNYWESKGDMSSFTWWVKPGQKNVYSDNCIGNPAIIVDLHDANVKIYGLSNGDAQFHNPNGVHALNLDPIMTFLEQEIGTSVFVKKRDWDWDVSKTQSPNKGIHPDNLLSAKLRLRFSNLEYVDSEYNDKKFEDFEPSSKWKAMDDADLGKKAGLSWVIKEQKSFNFNDKEELTRTFPEKFREEKREQGCKLKNGTEMVLSFETTSIRGIIYEECPSSEAEMTAIKRAKEMKAALKDKTRKDIPILTFEDGKIIKSQYDDKPYPGSEEDASLHKNGNKSTDDSGAPKGDMSSIGDDVVRHSMIDTVAPSKPIHQPKIGSNNQNAGAKRGGRPTKHSAKDLKRRAKAAQEKKRKKGKDGKVNRNPIKKAFKCYICASPCPDEKTMKIHFENKHKKLTIDLEKCIMTTNQLRV